MGGWALMMLAVVAMPAEEVKAKPSICVTRIEAEGTREEGAKPLVDEQLEKIQKRLPGKFAIYRYIGESCWSFAVGDAKGVDLPKPYALTLRREPDGDEGIRIRWVLKKAAKKMNESVVEFKNHGFLWLGGPQSDRGDIFVLLHAHWSQ